MTPSEEKTAEERGGSAFERAWKRHNQSEPSFKMDARRWFHIGERSLQSVKDAEITSLRLTNQRLEAEVERMKEVLKSIEGQIVGGYLSGRGEQSALWRIRELSSRGEQKGENQ